MIKQYITALMLACCVGVCGQEKKQASFVPPFDFPLTLSGNFGEIRSNHFHGGLDFKTGGVIGKPVRALADGYISRTVLPMVRDMYLMFAITMAILPSTAI